MKLKEMLQDIQKEVMKEDVIIKIEGKEREGMSSISFKLGSYIHQRRMKK